jgi:uncharacterized protein (TIGR02246 family)
VSANRPWWRGLRLSLLAGLTAGSAAATPPDPGLEAAQAAFVAAMEARDAEALAALFAHDGVVQVAGMPEFRGRDAIAGLYRNLFGFLVESLPEPEPLVRAGEGGLAYGTGRVTNIFQGPDGTERHQGKFVIVWAQTPEGWRIAAYAVSSDGQERAGSAG